MISNAFLNCILQLNKYIISVHKTTEHYVMFIGHIMWGWEIDQLGCADLFRKVYCEVIFWVSDLTVQFYTIKWYVHLIIELKNIDISKSLKWNFSQRKD